MKLYENVVDSTVLQNVERQFFPRDVVIYSNVNLLGHKIVPFLKSSFDHI